MAKSKTLRQILESNPGCHIHYHDSGSWVILKRKPTEDDWLTGRDEKIKELYEGDDFNLRGYLPELVEALASMAGITADSI